MVLGERGVGLIMAAPTPEHRRGCCDPRPGLGRHVHDAGTEFLDVHGLTVVVVGGLDGILGATARAGGHGRGDGPDAEDEDARVQEVQEADQAAERRLALELGSVRAARAELTERSRRDARARLDAEAADALQVLDTEAFLASAAAEYLVPGMLYRASTSKLYGPPGGTKSFLALDLALSVAAGRPWFGSTLDSATVHYVMAEGQAVNVGRVLAWLHHHGVTSDELGGRFVVVPQGVLLTTEGVAGYLERVRADRPALVVLDTKNAMMIGDENSATDVAVMVRAMREIRDAADGACVLLIDHTGLRDETRGRGSNAVTAAMDTEVRVDLDRDTRTATAEVTRDKDAEPGACWTYRLQSVDDVPGLERRPRPPAVVVANEGGPDRPVDPNQTWNDPLAWPLPTDVTALADGGKGAKAIRHVAMFMRAKADDPQGVGVTRRETVVALQAVRGPRGPLFTDDTVVRDAWSRLVAAGRISPRTTSGTQQSDWVTRPDDPGRK